MKTKLPTLKHEKRLWQKHRHQILVIGVDEVGRGCLAGPLVVGAVCFTPPLFSENHKKLKLSNKEWIEELENLGINDSKKLSANKREKLAPMIKKKARFWAVAKVSVNIIDKKGVVKATEMAVRKTIKKISTDISRFSSNYQLYILVDAFYIKYLRGIGLKNQKAIIHGDEISLSIAAASIVAKVHRDKLMKKLAKAYPNYRWELNKGYGTHDHIAAIKKHGLTKLHRKLFVRKI